jgi:hypothetical protein
MSREPPVVTPHFTNCSHVPQCSYVTTWSVVQSQTGVEERLRLALGMIIKLMRYSFFDSLYPALYTERYGSTLSAGN